MQKAIILLSGGLDSATVGAVAKFEDNCELYALTFDYMQRHHIEIDSAIKVGKFLGVKEHEIIGLSCFKKFGKTSLLDSSLKIPKHDKVEDLNKEIPNTFVPGRNVVFISIAAAWAGSIGASRIYFGATVSIYPDCQSKFVDNMQQTITAGINSSISIFTPIIKLTKAEIIKRGFELGVDYSITHSCFDPVYEEFLQQDVDGVDYEEHFIGACGKCDSCLLRKKGFEEAGIKDPTIYA